MAKWCLRCEAAREQSVLWFLLQYPHLVKKAISMALLMLINNDAINTVDALQLRQLAVTDEDWAAGW